MKSAWLALGLLAATSAAALASAPSFGEAVWYTERISSGDTPVQVDHLWSKGVRMRAETVFLGHPIVTIVNGDRYVMIDRLTRTGVSIQRSPKAIRDDAKRKRPFGNELEVLIAAGGEKVRTDDKGGRQCDLYRLTSDEGRQEVCVTTDEHQLPLFSRVWVRGSSMTGEARYLEWSRDIEIPDAFFLPDPGVTLEHVTYEDYLARAGKERIGPAPPMHRELLHGR